MKCVKLTHNGLQTAKQSSPPHPAVPLLHYWWQSGSIQTGTLEQLDEFWKWASVPACLVQEKENYNKLLGCIDTRCAVGLLPTWRSKGSTINCPSDQPNMVHERSINTCTRDAQHAILRLSLLHREPFMRSKWSRKCAMPAESCAQLHITTLQQSCYKWWCKLSRFIRLYIYEI